MYLLRKCLGYNLLQFGGLSTFSDSGHGSIGLLSGMNMYGFIAAGSTYSRTHCQAQGVHGMMELRVDEVRLCCVWFRPIRDGACFLWKMATEIVSFPIGNGAFP